MLFWTLEKPNFEHAASVCQKKMSSFKGYNHDKAKNFHKC